MKHKNGTPVTAYTVKPGQDTKITLTVVPNVICTLQNEGNTDKDLVMLLFSDAHGMVRIYVNPSGESEEKIKLQLQYEYDGNTVTRIIELYAHMVAITGMPFPEDIEPNSFTTKNNIRPALTPEQINTLTNNELLGAGYPMRPDQAEVPEAYDMWKKVVSQPAVIVPPVFIPHPYISCEPVLETPSGNWSGFELQSAPGTYDWVTGGWAVPKVAARTNEHDYSAIWVGIDDGLNYFPPGGGPPLPGDLVQAGTEQNCLNISWGGFFVVNIHSYYAWKEYLPTEPTQTVISSLAIHPGDQVYTQVWIGNNVAPFLPNLSGAYCFFQIENITTGHFVKIPTPVGLRQILGAAAEWITERPFLAGGVTSNLADYHAFKLSGACAKRAGVENFVYYNRAPYIQYKMVGTTGTTLSTVAAGTVSIMEFDWHDYS